MLRYLQRQAECVAVRLAGCFGGVGHSGDDGAAVTSIPWQQLSQRSGDRLANAWSLASAY
jgi:hypothetical protein